MARPIRYYRENVGALAVLLDAVAEAGRIRRFLFSSPTAVYGDPGVDLITEDTPCAPVNPYGEAKLAGEWLVRAAGAGARHRDDLPALLQRGRGGGAGTGRQRRLQGRPDGLRPAHPQPGPADLRRRWRRPGDAPRAVASAELAARELGFRARRDVRETVGSAWRGRRSHHV
jgi:UDP-glucose 4-epimerase